MGVPAQIKRDATEEDLRRVRDGAKSYVTRGKNTRQAVEDTQS